jgi:thiamine biosynthesis lipoprotein ApbE
VTGVQTCALPISTAALADGLSTAFAVLGPAAALEYCREHAEIGLAMISRGEGQSKLQTAGFGVGEWV